MRIGTGLFAMIGAALLSGCASSSITNLTPRTQLRNSENVYPVEIEFTSNLRTIRKESIRPYVQIGNDNYLMRKTPVVKNRWETLVPAAPETQQINYRVKVDFNYNSIPEPKPNSVLSGHYQLQITE